MTPFPEDEKKEEEKDPLKDEPDGRSLAETIESISRAVPIFHNEGEIHRKITDGIKNIFQNGKPGDESEEKSGEEDDQISGQINFSDIIPEVPRMNEEEIPSLESVDSSDVEDSSEEEPVFNLEESILAAAQAQGIDLPDEPAEPEKETADSSGEELEEKTAGEQTAEIPEDAEAEKVSENEEIIETAETAEIEKSEEPEASSVEDISEDKDVSEEPAEDTSAIAEPKEQLSEEEELMRFIDEQNRDPNIDDTDIVPREEVLDDDEIKLFKYFSLVPGMKEQIAVALKDAQLSAADKTSRDGNIIIMGNKGCGKTMLAELLIKAICRELKLPAVRMAKVKADQLKGQDIAKIVDKLSGGFLLIQNVNQLDADSVDTLNQAMEFRTDGLTVLLEDEKIGMRKFIARNPKFINKFTSTISVPVFTNDELVSFAKIYTQERGYVIDDMAILALYTLISDNQKEDEPMTVNGVKMIIDNAIAKEQSGIRKLLSRNHTDRDGNVILYEKDFK